MPKIDTVQFGLWGFADLSLDAQLVLDESFLYEKSYPELLAGVYQQFTEQNRRLSAETVFENIKFLTRQVVAQFDPVPYEVKPKNWLTICTYEV
jgi:hypothetical protein